MASLKLALHQLVQNTLNPVRLRDFRPIEPRLLNGSEVADLGASYIY